MKNVTYDLCVEIKQELEKSYKTNVMKKYGLNYKQMDHIVNGEFDSMGIINDNSSILRKMTKSELKEITDSSTSYSEAIRKFNLVVTTSYIKILKKLIEYHEIDVTHFKAKQYGYRPPLDSSELFSVSSFRSGVVKRRIIRDNLIPYICSECSNDGVYNNKPLVLQLDHINGNNVDNRLENLRFLCPNCHSQTDNYTGKNVTKKPNCCIDCGVNIKRVSLRCDICREIFKKEPTKTPNESIYLQSNVRNKTCECGETMTIRSKHCYRCSQKKPKRFEISKEELENLVKEKPMTEIGKMFGVSDNAVKKRCKHLGIVVKDMRGYWKRIEASKK